MTRFPEPSVKWCATRSWDWH